MNWSDIEKAFHRAALLSLSKKKLVLTLPILILCGILIIFCRAVARDASDWVAMSFLFLPILLSSGILLSLGVLLVRLHHHEAKGLVVDFKQLMSASIDLIIGISYLAILPIFAYLFLWVVLGIFFLLKEIPGIGHFFSVILSFGPFLLIFGSLILCLFNLGLLFFIAPAAALQSHYRPLMKKIFEILVKKPLSAGALFLIALIPIGILAGLLSLAAFLTNMNFAIADHSLSMALEWFFIMLPFSAIFAPAVIFFFNFSAESYQLLHIEPFRKAEG